MDGIGVDPVGSGKAQLTVLNAMASRDFDHALAVIKEWGLEWVDLWGLFTGSPSTR